MQLQNLYVTECLQHSNFCNHVPLTTFVCVCVDCKVTLLHNGRQAFCCSNRQDVTKVNHDRWTVEVGGLEHAVLNE